MATFRLAAGPLGVMAAALIADLDSHASNSYAELYAGTMPATIATAISGQTKLGTVTMSNDPSATNSAGLITFNPISEDTAADASGTASFLRIYKGDASTWADLDVGGPGSGATAIVNTVTVVAGGPIRINAFTITVG